MSETTLLQKFKQIQEIFNNTGVMPQGNQPQEKQFSEYALQDGTPVSIDKLEAGGMVQVNGQPAPAGEHILADGTKLKVAEGGIIESVEAPAADPNAAPEGNQFATVQAFEEHKQAFTQYQQAAEQRFSGYERQIGEFSTALSQSQETMQKLMGVVEQMLKTEVAPPAETKTSFSKVEIKQKSINKFLK